jgi:hypothetical protein
MTLSPESGNSSGELTRLPDFTIPPYDLPPRPCWPGSSPVSKRSKRLRGPFRSFLDGGLAHRFDSKRSHTSGLMPRNALTSQTLIVLP